MKSKLLICLMLLLSGNLFAAQPITNSPPQKLIVWKSINYPFPKNLSNEPAFFISSGKQYDQVWRGLRLDIMEIVQGFQFIKTNGITAQLYRANGEIVEPTDEGKKLLNTPISVSTFSGPDWEPLPQVMTYFPWGTNNLEECWIKISIGMEWYWLEIPYGFDQNPTDTPASSISGGPPKLISAMKSLTTHDHIVRWQNVEYDFGEIQNDWRLSLKQSNLPYAESEVVLYKDPEEAAKLPWNLSSPHTTVRILDADGTTINGRCTNLHLNDDGLRRTDTFDFGCYGNSLRSRGKIEISVDDKVFDVNVPSSLYKCVHGHANINMPGVLDFLADIPSLKEVSLNMSEAELLKILNRQKIAYTNGDENGMTVYQVRPKEHVVVIFTFMQGQCGGIQRLPD